MFHIFLTGLHVKIFFNEIYWYITGLLCRHSFVMILAECRIIAQVCEHSLGGTDDVRGEVIIDLRSLPFDEEPTVTGWYALNMEVRSTDDSVSLRTSKLQSFEFCIFASCFVFL